MRKSPYFPLFGSDENESFLGVVPRMIWYWPLRLKPTKYQAPHCPHRGVSKKYNENEFKEVIRQSVPMVAVNDVIVFVKVSEFALFKCYIEERTDIFRGEKLSTDNRRWLVLPPFFSGIFLSSKAYADYHHSN